MDKKIDTNVISVSGFGYSGSGLIIDFLNFSNNTSFSSVEFRLLKDVDGLMSLRNFFLNEANHMNTDIALQRFYRFCFVLAKMYRIVVGDSSKHVWNISNIYYIIIILIIRIILIIPVVIIISLSLSLSLSIYIYI